jgi:hypothetical protein
MKKVISALARLSLIAVLGLSVCTVSLPEAFAADTDVAVSSAVPTASAGDYTANGGPVVSGNLFVRQFVIGNYLGASVQNVSIYDNCTASHTATLRMVIPVAASSTYTSVLYPAGNPGGFQLASPCVSKTDANSTVNFTLIYQ